MIRPAARYVSFRSMTPTLRLFGFALACTALSACETKQQAPQAQANAAQQPAAGSAQAEAAEHPAARAEAEAKAPAAESQGPAQTQDLGQRFRDPPWFRKTMLEGAKAVDTARSETDEAGRFKSHILFELPAGSTVEQCADQVTEKIKGDVPNLERSEQGDGRLRIEGSTDRYKVVVMCGEAKGVTKAYVGYEWTAA